MSKTKSDVDIITTELCMLTGKMNKDRNYLYYLLLKDGSYFKNEEKEIKICSESTVDRLEDWFAKL